MLEYLPVLLQAIWVHSKEVQMLQTPLKSCFVADKPRLGQLNTSLQGNLNSKCLQQQQQQCAAWGQLTVAGQHCSNSQHAKPRSHEGSTPCRKHSLIVYAQVKTVYLLVRAKNNVPAAKRVQDLLSSPLFNMLHQDILSGKRNPFSRVHPVEGDLTKPSLGLTHQDLRLLRTHVNLVLHCGACIELEADVQKTLRSAHFKHDVCILRYKENGVSWCNSACVAMQ